MKRIVCLLSFCLVFLSTVFAETADSLSQSDDLRPTTSMSMGISIGRENHHVIRISFTSDVIDSN